MQRTQPLSNQQNSSFEEHTLKDMLSSKIKLKTNRYNSERYDCVVNSANTKRNSDKTKKK